jgi:predicted DCC family thiol-disulfide oxidoreductase YuxK
LRRQYAGGLGEGYNLAMAKPTLVYDGDCGFCKLWVSRWRHLTGDAVAYASSQEAAPRFPNIPPEAFDRAVQFVAADGSVTEGAAAVFMALERAPWPGPLGSWAYRRLPGFAAASEAAYRLVARNRAAASRLSRLLWGTDPEPSTFHLARWLFVKGVALCYLLAFLSWAAQWEGLVGARGVHPAAELLAQVRAAVGARAWLELPTVFWAVGASDAALSAVNVLGSAVAVLVLAGFAPAAGLALLWALYLSVYSVGSVFLGFQWDVLLLEAGVLAFLCAPWGLRPRLGTERSPAAVPLLLTRWLWFRLMFLAGAVKLASGDGSWWDLSALTFHFETQPLPHALSWYAHMLPDWMLEAGCLWMFLVELVLPFAAFLPRRPRWAAFWGVNALMLAIALTGNYTFFNLLAVALSVVLLDDAQWGRILPALRARLGSPAGRPAEPRPRRAAAWAFAAFVVPVSLAAGLVRVYPQAAASAPVRALASAGRTAQLVNAYGLFAVMTRPRREIVLEGSHDGLTWEPFEFRWKPGDPARRPGWVQPHQPRLDWQMWFAALAPYQQNPWYLLMLQRLLEGSPPVRALFARAPFERKPPALLRSTLYEYGFARPGVKDGAWWVRKPLGLYAPVVMLTDDGRLAAVELRPTAGR